MFCKHCGKEIDEDSTFCKWCGKNIAGGSAPDDMKPEAPTYQAIAPNEPIYTGKSDNSHSKPRSDGCVPYIVFFIAAVALISIILLTFGFSSNGEGNLSMSGQPTFSTQSPPHTPAKSQTSSSKPFDDSKADSDYKKLTHSYAVSAIQIVMEQYNITKYDRLGWYYPEVYTLKDGIHYSASKLDYYDSEHTYTVGITFNEDDDPTVVYIMLDDQVLLDKRE